MAYILNNAPVVQFLRCCKATLKPNQENDMKTKHLLIQVLTMLCLCWGLQATAEEKKPVEEPAITVNINNADAETLAQRLVGIGLTRAQAIVQYRETHGRFYSAEELSAVTGVGMATVLKNADRIRTE
jgi:competence protein ComEA